MTAAAPWPAKTANQCWIGQFYGAFTALFDFAHRAATGRARRLASIGAGRVRRMRSASMKLLILLLAVVLAGYLLAAVWNPERF